MIVLDFYSNKKNVKKDMLFVKITFYLQISSVHNLLLSELHDQHIAQLASEHNKVTKVTESVIVLKKISSR